MALFFIKEASSDGKILKIVYKLQRNMLSLYFSQESNSCVLTQDT